MPGTLGQVGCARYTPGQDPREYVSAGQGHTRQPSPEPRPAWRTGQPVPPAGYWHRRANRSVTECDHTTRRRARVTAVGRGREIWVTHIRGRSERGDLELSEGTPVSARTEPGLAGEVAPEHRHVVVPRLTRLGGVLRRRAPPGIAQHRQLSSCRPDRALGIWGSGIYARSLPGSAELPGLAGARPRRRESATPARHSAPPAIASQPGTWPSAAHDISTVMVGTR
jgi:hypothetical protein